MIEKRHEEQIREVLKDNPRGLTISEIAHKIGLNRNSTAKYLKVLEANGQVESLAGGTAKCYYLPRRLPQSMILGISSDLVCTFDSEHFLTYANDPFFNFFGIDNEETRYCNISELVSGSGRESLLPEVFIDLLDAGEQVREFTLDRNRERVYLRAKAIPTPFEDGTRGTTIICEDITVERKYLENLEFLARTSAELAAMGDEKNVFQYIVDRIAELEPGSCITVGSVHPETQDYILRALSGCIDLVEECGKRFGDPRGIRFSTANVPWARSRLSHGSLLPGPESFYIQAYKMYPKEFCDEIQERLRLGKCYVMGCTCRGGLYGNIAIRLRKGEELRNPETVEAFVKQAGIALQKRYLREKQRGGRGKDRHPRSGGKSFVA
jgi:PAS domain-containing protein